MTYHEIKEKNKENIAEILTVNKAFWAFSEKQLQEGKDKIGEQDNKKLFSFGHGGYLPKVNADKFFDEMEAENKRYKQELKDAKEATEQAILYELRNYECFYTGDCDDVICLFKDVYQPAEILKVFKNNQQTV